MSWSVKIAGSPKNVARELRGYKSRPNMYADAQRDALFEITASQVEQMTFGVSVEGSGHAGSTFSIKLDSVEIAETPAELEGAPPATAA